MVEGALTMKRHVSIGVMVIALILAGCEAPEGRQDHTATGALTGAAIGAGTGAIIGGRHAGEGALIGGGIGAVAGGLVGHEMDSVARERVERESPQTLQRFDQGQPLGLADVKALSRAGVSDEVIMSQIRNSRVVYRLSTAEIIDLKDSGVSQRVIDFMVNTPSLYPPPPPRPPRYYYRY